MSRGYKELGAGSHAMCMGGPDVCSREGSVRVSALGFGGQTAWFFSISTDFFAVKVIFAAVKDYTAVEVMPLSPTRDRLYHTQPLPAFRWVAGGWDKLLPPPLLTPT